MAFDKKRQSWLQLIQCSLKGDLHATRNLVQLIELNAHREWLEEEFLANGLSQILFSPTIGFEQKWLIWSLKDAIVYMGSAGEREVGNGKPQENRLCYFTFFDYLRRFRSAEMRSYISWHFP